MDTYTSAAAKSLRSCLTLRPHGLQPTRLLRPWDSPGKSTEVGAIAFSAIMLQHITFDFLFLCFFCHVSIPVSHGLLIFLYSSLFLFFCCALYVLFDFICVLCGDLESVPTDSILSSD